MLPAMFEPAHGMIDLQRKPTECDFFTAQQPFVSETASYIRRNHSHRTVLQAQAFAQAGLNGMRKLGRCDEREITQPRITKGENATTFHREHAMPGSADVPRDLDGRGLGDVVNGTIFAELDENVVAPLFMHQGRSRLTSLEHIDDGRQLVEFKCNGAGNVLCFRPRRCHAHCNHFADIANLVSCQDRFDGVFKTLKRRRGNDGLNAGQMRCGENDLAELFGDVDFLDPRMGYGTAYECNLASARHADIADILSASAQEPIILLAWDRGSDSGLCD